MVAFAIKEFGGEIPRTQGRNLPNNNAEQAANCDLSSGNLEGLPIPQLVVDLSATPGTQRAYRYPVEGDADVWLPLPSPYSSVCRSPLANDTSQRLFWTNPVGSSAPGAWWNTRARIGAGLPPYNLGVIQPNPTVAPTVVVTGGTLGGPISLAAVLSGGIAYAAGDTGTVLGASGDATYTVTSIVGAPVTGATVLIGGTGYAVGDTGIIKGATGDATYIVLTVSTGVVSTLSVSSPGTLYTTGVYNTVTGGAQPGAGSGLTLGVTVSAPGVVATILLSDAGTDYVGGTYATATGGSQPGLGTGLTLTVTAVLEIPEVTRSYCWTYVNQYGEESAPSGPSAPVTGASNGTWVVSGLPTTAPTNPAGINYPPTTGVNLYRTVTGATTGAEFFQVAQFSFTGATGGPITTATTLAAGTGYNVNDTGAILGGSGDANYTVMATVAVSGAVAAFIVSVPGSAYPPGTYTCLAQGAQPGVGSGFQLTVNSGSFSTPPSSYTDALPDTSAVENLTLVSASWSNPLPNLDGMIMLAGGMLVGFTGNTVHFCEPNYMHAWPAGYDESVLYSIVALGVWQGSLIVLTAGYPSTGTGTSPANFTLTQLRVPEPCLARGSVITDLAGVYYASQNGLIMLNYFGMQNQTLSTMTKNIWLTKFNAASIIACRHRSQYLALTLSGAGTGFLIDYAEARMGVMPLSTFADATAVWNDEYSGDAYVCAGGLVYLWDSPVSAPQTFRWRSKQFYGVKPVNLGACQISLDPDVLTPPPSPNTIALANDDATLVLPAGANAVFNLYAGPDGEHLVHTQVLDAIRNIFPLPSGFKSFDWQAEIVSRVGVRSIELATTMQELNTV